jgi:hypothetical protein
MSDGIVAVVFEHALEPWGNCSSCRRPIKTGPDGDKILVVTDLENKTTTVYHVEHIDLPYGYRWATHEETEAFFTPPGATWITRTFDSTGRKYEEGEQDLAVKITSTRS